MVKRPHVQKLSLSALPRRNVTAFDTLRAALIEADKRAARKRDHDARMRAAMARLEHIK